MRAGSSVTSWAAAAMLMMIAARSFLFAGAVPRPVGVCYGMQGDNLPPPAEVIALYKSAGIEKIRLFDPNPAVLQALRGSGITVAVGVANQDIPALATSRDAALGWLQANVQPFPDVAFTHIVVGNEAIPGGGDVAAARDHVHDALPSLGSAFANIKVTTTLAAAALGQSYPPSQGAFSATAVEQMTKVAAFLAQNGQPLMVNVYPYFAYASDPVNVNVNYALCGAGAPPVQDGGLTYTCLVDAQLDAFYSALEAVGGGNVVLTVSEIGWPSAGNGEATTLALAQAHNENHYYHLLKNGTPKRPGTIHEVFFFAMFNEDLKPEGIEQHWGFYYPDKTPVYPFF